MYVCSASLLLESSESLPAHQGEPFAPNQFRSWPRFAPPPAPRTKHGDNAIVLHSLLAAAAHTLLRMRPSCRAMVNQMSYAPQVYSQLETEQSANVIKSHTYQRLVGVEGNVSFDSTHPGRWVHIILYVCRRTRGRVNVRGEYQWRQECLILPFAERSVTVTTLSADDAT
jgi:hypothetical protein